jgi:hypothetical protein
VTLGAKLRHFAKLRRLSMKLSRKIFYPGLCCLLWSVQAFAQNGAMIERHEAQTFWAEFDGNDTIVVIANTLGLDTFCGIDTELVDGTWTLIDQPNEMWKSHINGDVFAQVYSPASSVFDVFFCPLGDVAECACDYWVNGPMIAEGIVHWTDNDNGHRTCGGNISGTLYDLTGNCSSGMVDLNTIRRFKYDADGNCSIPHVIKGPRLECIE